MRFLSLAFALLATSPFASPLFGQSPKAIIVSRLFAYEQTGPDTVVAGRPTLSISVQYDIKPSAAQGVEATCGDKTYTLAKDPLSGPVQSQAQDGSTVTLLAESYSFRQEFPDTAGLNAALPASDITVKVTRNGLTTNTVMRLANAVSSTPRITNFDALQNWNGESLSISWTPIPGATFFAPSIFAFRRADGTTVGDTSDNSEPLAWFFYTPGFFAAPPMTSRVLSSVSAAPGEILTGTFVSSTSLAYSVDVPTQLFTLQAVRLIFPLKRPAPAPIITSQPLPKTVLVGGEAIFSVVADGASVTYAWQKDGVAIAGATQASLTLTKLQLADSGRYTATATNSGGSITSAAAILSVETPLVIPTIATAPAGVMLVAGARTTLSVTAAGTPPFTYQWFRDGLPLGGATAGILTLNTTLPADAGSYTVRVTNAAGSVTSAAAVVTVTPVSRISNLSVLASIDGAGDSFSLGYVVGGTGTTGAKPLVIRTVGPSLSTLNVAGPLADPRFELFAGSVKTSENDNWGGSVSLATAVSAVGAFPYTGPTSKDAATTANISTRDNSVKISSADNGSGLVLGEVYDATPAGFFTIATPRLLNVSVIKPIGTGLTVGFTLAGSAPKTVLIRAVGGPALAGFGVANTAADPQLTLFNGTSVKLAENDNWGGTATLTAAFTATGAFGLPAASKDAALLTTLPPGSYSVQVSGVPDSANRTGSALVEVYEVP